MIELTLFRGNLKELKQKFALEFISRYGLNKKEEEVIAAFQSWMNRDRTFTKKQLSSIDTNSLKAAAKKTKEKFE